MAKTDKNNYQYLNFVPFNLPCSLFESDITFCHFKQVTINHNYNTIRLIVYIIMVVMITV